MDVVDASRPIPDAIPDGDDEFGGLVLRYLDGLTTPDENQRLSSELEQSAARREQAVAVCLQYGCLVEVLAMQQQCEHELQRSSATVEVGPAGEASRNALANTVRRFAWVGAAGAAIMLVVAALALFVGRSNVASPVPIARLEQLKGTVYLLAEEGRRPALAGESIFRFQGLATADEESQAQVHYSDGSVLELGPNTALEQLEDAASKRVVLLRGVVSLRVVPQPDASPLVLSSPDAEVVVRGTRFTCTANTGETRIEVEHGLVQFRRRSDGRSIDVATGQAATASTKDTAAKEPAGEPHPFAANALPTIYRQPHDILPLKGRPITALAFSPQGDAVAVAVRESVKLLDYPGGSERLVLRGDDRLVRSLAFAPHGELLAAGGSDGLVRLFDARTGGQRATLTGHGGRINAVAFSSDGATVASAAGHFSDAGEVFLWDTADGRQITAMPDEKHGTPAVAFSPRGDLLAAGSHGPRVRLWDTALGVERDSLPHEGGGRALAFSPVGQMLASGGNFYDRTVRLWEMATDQLTYTLAGHLHHVNIVAFSPDGELLATASADTTVRLWNPHSGKEIGILHGHNGGVEALAFSPDGRLLASAGVWDREIKLWEVAALFNEETAK